MKIKHTLMLFCVTIFLALFMVACADSSEGSNATADNQSNLDYQSNSNFQSNADYLEQSNTDWLAKSNTDWLAKSNTDWINSITVADVSKENCEHADLSLNCFISGWKTENSGGGASATNEVKLPLVSEGTYDFYVDWGDGEEVEKITTASTATHEYATPGEYTVHIAGTIKGWRFFVDWGDFGDAAKLTDVSQWGSLSLGNTAGRQFQGANNFNSTAADAPNLSETTDLIHAFAQASNFNGKIGNWDVSKVTNVNYLFSSATNFNQDIAAWNVSKVITMDGMFQGATNFNNGEKVLDWGEQTGNVTSMITMFQSATSFNQNISSWNVSKVITMRSMFNTAEAFNQNLLGWTVDQVADHDNFAAQSGLALNNTPLKFRELSTVSKEQCEINVYLKCFISAWNTTNIPTDDRVKPASEKPNGYSETNQVKLPLVGDGTYNFYVNWGDGTDVQKITKFDADETIHTYSNVGEQTIYIAGEITGWRFFSDSAVYGDAVKLADVKQWGSLLLGNTAGRQFQGAENFNPTATDTPNLSNTTDLNSAFSNANSFNAPIGNWDVSQVTKMNSMFSHATNFNQDISSWDVNQVNTMSHMFRSASNFNNGGNPLNWDSKMSNVETTYAMFYQASEFNQSVSEWEVRQVTDMRQMFASTQKFNNGGSALTWGDNTSNVRDMNGMFWGASVFNQDISGWNVVKLGDMNNMFTEATAFNQDISDWNLEVVTRMNSVFKDATSFNNGGVALNWEAKTSKVTDMRSMFHGASNFNQAISDWNIGSVGDMRSMFQNANLFNQDISGWNVEKVEKYDNFATDSALSDAYNPFKP